MNESVSILMTNLKRESTIKKSTTHVVSGAFDVVDYFVLEILTTELIRRVCPLIAC